MIRVEHADMLEAIPRLVAEGVVCDAVVTDPPYHLTSGNLSVDYSGYGPRTDGGSDRGSTNRAARKGGFMGQTWDGGDIAFRPETWATVATILRPGAFLVAFGGCRTYHRMACAIEDGGFVIQDCILWLYATGFPKHRDMLKPAVEMICLAYKHGGKRTMQIDECRVGIADGDGWDVPRMSFDGDARVFGSNGRIDAHSTPHTAGRWPANVAHDGSDEVLAAFPDSGSGSGRIHKAGPGEQPFKPERGWNGHSMTRDGATAPDDYGDSGSAARFFFSAKAGAQDRWGSRHPTVKPVELMKWLVALVTPPGGACIDPFAGSGTTGVATLATGRNAILIEREAQYHADILERMAHYEGSGRHSLASKGRQARPRGETPLFDQPYDEDKDAHQSYLDAVSAIGAKADQ